MAVSKFKFTRPILFLHIGFGWFIYSLLWPFGAFISSIYRFRKPEAKTIFWLFCVYFGFSFVIPEDFAGAADSARYATALIEMHARTVSFENLLNALYDPAIGFVDVYQPLATWLISIFTDDPKWLFSLFGGVFGFFYAQNIWLLLKHVNIKVTLVLFLFILGYALTNPIWNINGVRMWTAAQMFLYGILLYFMENRKTSGIIWLTVSILFHYSFLFPVGVFFLYLFLPESLMVYLIFYLLAAFINEINLVTVRESLSFLPDVFQPRVDAYTNLDYALSIKEKALQSAWHVRFAQLASRIVIYSWVIVVFFSQRYWHDDSKRILKKVFAFALFIGGWANIAALVPAGGRFLIITNGLFYFIFVLSLIQPKIMFKFKTIRMFTIPFLLFSLIFSLRLGFDFISFLTVIGNPFLVAIVDFEQTPLIEFIKKLF
jgi:hypothetical protein